VSRRQRAVIHRSRILLVLLPLSGMIDYNAQQVRSNTTEKFPRHVSSTIVAKGRLTRPRVAAKKEENDRHSEGIPQWP